MDEETRLALAHRSDDVTEIRRRLDRLEGRGYDQWSTRNIGEVGGELDRLAKEVSGLELTSTQRWVRDVDVTLPSGGMPELVRRVESADRNASWAQHDAAAARRIQERLGHGQEYRSAISNDWAKMLGWAVVVVVVAIAIVK